MNVRPIVIESNRELAYRNIIQETINTDNTPSKLLVDFPNNRWTTSIDSGIPIKIGDTIQLDSAMINSIGGGGEVMEFTGETGLQTPEGYDIRDNEVELDLVYYVSNNQAFNFNLPKSRFQTQYDMKNLTYGGPSFWSGGMAHKIPWVPDSDGGKMNFYNWERCYPYQCIEGAITEFDIALSDTRPYIVDVIPKDSNTLASHSKANKPLYKPNGKRLYVGNNYQGPYRIIQTPDQGLGKALLINTWDYFKRKTRLNIKNGFTTPSAIGNNLTSQLHNRQGNASHWDENTVEAKYFDAGTYAGTPPGPAVVPVPITRDIIQVTVPAITDETMLTFPNATGKMWYRATKVLTEEEAASYTHYENGWNAEYSVGNSDIERGYSYDYIQGISTYYQNMMTARPDYVKAGSYLNSIVTQRPTWSSFPATSLLTTPYVLWTGASVAVTDHFMEYNTDSNPETLPATQAGSMGVGVMIMDILPSEVRGGGAGPPDIKYYNNMSIPVGGEWAPAGVNIAPAIRCLDLKEGNLIPTNLIWSNNTMEILKKTFDDYFELIDTDVTNLDINDDAFLDAHIMRLNIGRIDDQQVVPSSEECELGPPYTDLIKTGSPGANEQYVYRPVYMAPPSINNYFQPQSFASGTQSPYHKQKTGPSVGKPFYSGEQIQENISLTVATTGLPFPLEAPTVQNNVSIMGSCEDTNMEIHVKHFLNSRWTAQNAKNNVNDVIANLREAGGLREGPTTSADASIMNIYPAYTDPNYAISFAEVEALYDMIPVLKGGGKLSIVPVFMNEGKASSTGIDDSADERITRTAYVAFVYHGRPNYDPQQPGYVDYPLPCVGEYFGFSNSETTCQLSQMVTTQKTKGFQQMIEGKQIRHTELNMKDSNKYIQPPTLYDLTVDPFAPIRVNPMIYIPFNYVGANDAAILFDAGTSRFDFQNLHTPYKKGNGRFQGSDLISEGEPEQNIIEWSGKSAAICSKAYGFETQAIVPALVDGIQSYLDILSSASNQSSISVQSGVAVQGISLITTLDTSYPLTPYDALLYENTLFNKMGFVFEQLLPLYGLPQNQFNRGNYNKYIGWENSIYLKQINIVKPLTTNAYISAAINIAMSRLRQQTVQPDSAGGALESAGVIISPAGNLGTLAPMNVANTNAISDKLQALELPSKLDYPYLVLYSDIVDNPAYYGGPDQGQKLQAIAYLARNYETGDYYFSNPTSWNYTVDSDRIITSITTDIRLPDGRPAQLGPKSAVMYKILSSSPAPTLPNKTN